MTDAMDVCDPRLAQRRFGFGDSEGRPRQLSKQHKAILNSFSDPILKRITEMSDQELWAFIEAGNSVSMSNCGWDAYAIAKAFLDSAVWEMKTRVASGMEAASAGETTQIGSTEGDSPTAESGDAQPSGGSYQ